MYNVDICLDIANEYLDAYAGKIRAENEITYIQVELRAGRLEMVELMQMTLLDLQTKGIIYGGYLLSKKTLDKSLENAEADLKMFLSELDGLFHQLQNAGCL